MFLLVEIELLSMLKPRKFHHKRNMFEKIMNIRKKLLHILPEHLISCFYSILCITLTDKKTNQFTNIPILKNTYFNEMDYIDCVLVEKCALRYVSVHSGKTMEEVNDLYKEIDETTWGTSFHFNLYCKWSRMLCPCNARCNTLLYFWVAQGEITKRTAR